MRENTLNIALLGALLGDKLLDERRTLHENANVLVAHLLHFGLVHAELDETTALGRVLASLARGSLARTDM
jgi:hypothetical protein